MVLKRINLTEEDNLKFEQFRKKNHYRSDMAMHIIIEQAFKNIELEKERIQKEDELFEMVQLLVKANKELPPKSNPEEMSRYVNAPSRFDDLIREKVERMKKDGNY